MSTKVPGQFDFNEVLKLTVNNLRVINDESLLMTIANNRLDLIDWRTDCVRSNWYSQIGNTFQDQLNGFNSRQPLWVTSHESLVDDRQRSRISISDLHDNRLADQSYQCPSSVEFIQYSSNMALLMLRIGFSINRT